MAAMAAITLHSKTERLVRRTTMAATVAAAYFLSTAHYGSEPNAFDPAAALLALGMDSEDQAAAKEGTMLESKRSKAAGQK